MSKSDAYKRGEYDARRELAPLFWRSRRGIEPTIDDDGADAWEDLAREEYLKGYNDTFN